MSYGHTHNVLVFIIGESNECHFEPSVYVPQSIPKVSLVRKYIYMLQLVDQK